ncbi:hypothetical protein [Vibrio cyclitrophicus]|uniref:hypothetical protein n=1 Tax=Vibrio cyclitrophicus TaxID=47951 RepID=UPI0002D45B1A|nr:hypothetical protein [Vibrio cyclitrophicus]OED88629.1 hypothetical protein OAQ_19630 [Vibrio cyclitrophicus ZF30]
MTQTKAVKSGYEISLSSQKFVSYLETFEIPKGETKQLKKLRIDLASLLNELKAFIEAYPKLSYADEFFHLQKVDTKLMNLSVWVPFNLRDGMKISDLGIPEDVWESFKDRLEEYKNDIKPYMVNLTPPAIKKMHDEVTLLTHSLKEINDEQNELSTTLKQVELNNINLIKSAALEASKELTELRNSAKLELDANKDKLLDSFEQEVSSETSKLGQAIRSLEDKLVNEITDIQDSLDARVVSLNSELEKAIKVEVKSFANQKNKLTQVLGSLSEFRRAKSDISNADYQRQQADSLRRYGLSSMLLPLLAFVLFFVSIENQEGAYSAIVTLPSDVSGYLIRFLTIILFSSPSVYLLKESAYHRKQELVYRNRGVQLGSIGAFLEDVPAEVKTTIKQDLVKTFYGPADGKADVSNVPDMVQQIKDVALLSKTLSKIHSPKQNTSDTPSTSTKPDNKG